MFCWQCGGKLERVWSTFKTPDGQELRVHGVCKAAALAQFRSPNVRLKQPETYLQRVGHADDY